MKVSFPKMTAQNINGEISRVVRLVEMDEKVEYRSDLNICLGSTSNGSHYHLGVITHVPATRHPVGTQRGVKLNPLHYFFSNYFSSLTK